MKTYVYRCVPLTAFFLARSSAATRAVSRRSASVGVITFGAGGPFRMVGCFERVYSSSPQHRLPIFA